MRRQVCDLWSRSREWIVPRLTHSTRTHSLREWKNNIEPIWLGYPIVYISSAAESKKNTGFNLHNQVSLSESVVMIIIYWSTCDSPCLIRVRDYISLGIFLLSSDIITPYEKAHRCASRGMTEAVPTRQSQPIVNEGRSDNICNTCRLFERCSHFHDSSTCDHCESYSSPSVHPMFASAKSYGVVNSGILM